MSISDLYSSGKQQQNLGYFASIVKIAKADGNISKEEEVLLERMSRNLDITEDKFEEVYKNPEGFPVNAPVSYDERIERLYYLTKMIFADGEAELAEVTLMRKIAIALNIPTDNAEKVCDEAVHLVMNDNDLEEFTSAIKKVNSI